MRTANWRAERPRLLVVATTLMALAATACSGLAPGANGSPDASAAPSTAAPPSAAISPPPTPTPEPVDPDGNHVATGLAFAMTPSPESPRTEIFLVEPDGSLRQITNLDADQGTGGASPVWSPDGEQLAFGPAVLGSGARPATLLVEADGSNQRIVKEFDFEEFHCCSWSADSRLLLFSDATPPGDRRLWLADLVSGEVTRIGTGAAPHWLPGDRQIAFFNGVTGRVPGDPEALTPVIFVMDRDELAPRIFAEADAATWSPDGGSVLIERSGTLLLADAGGSDPQEFARGVQPAWSPDGSRVVFHSGTDADGQPLLTLMDLDGQVAWSGVAGSAPAWSSDGSRLAVQVAYPDPVVRVLSAATGEQLWETAGIQPAWRP